MSDNNDNNDNHDNDNDDDDNNNNNNNKNNSNRIERCNSRFLQSSRTDSNLPEHVRSSGQGAIVCKSRESHRALISCKMSCATWYEGAAQLLALT